VKQGLRIRLSALIEAPSVLANRFRRNGNDFPEADLNEAARAADASREANGAVYGERLK
jgi:hypothetical protein